MTRAWVLLWREASFLASDWDERSMWWVDSTSSGFIQSWIGRVGCPQNVTQVKNSSKDCAFWHFICMHLFSVVSDCGKKKRPGSLAMHNFLMQVTLKSIAVQIFNNAYNCPFKPQEHYMSQSHMPTMCWGFPGFDCSHDLQYNSSAQ